MEQFLKQCRLYFVYAGIFSLFLNMLMLTLPIYMLQIFDRVITSRSQETLVMLTIAAVTAFFLHMIFELLRSRILMAAGTAIDGLAGPPVLGGVLDAAVRPGGNEYLTSLRDVALVRTFLTGSGINALFDSPWVPIFIAVIFMFHPLLGILATCGAVTLFVLALINERVTRKPLDDLSDKTRRASGYIDAGVRNAEVISAMGMQDNIRARWQRMNDEVIDAQVLASRRGGILGGLTRFIRLALQILMLATGATLVIQQHVSPGIMIAGTLILARALAPIETAIHTWKGFVDARYAYKRLQDLLILSPVQEQRVELPPPRGRIDVEGVGYSLPGEDRPIIKGISFSLEAGESLGLVGPSAAGKSTLARLVTGIWRPTAGIVRLDNADISRWPREFLGPHIGYLPQDVELFDGSVGENISRLNEVVAEQVVRAAQRAHTHDLILRLSKAYDTQIGPGGVALSAGQRQRVALARALYGNPRLVVLDEPNANLDTEGEEALVNTLQQLAKDGVTVITITHRPSLLSSVDKLLVLKDGQIEIFGPRAEVLARITPRGIREAGDKSPRRAGAQET